MRYEVQYSMRYEVQYSMRYEVQYSMRYSIKKSLQGGGTDEGKIKVNRQKKLENRIEEEKFEEKKRGKIKQYKKRK